MKNFAKIAFGAVMLAGAATAVASSPAQAQVSFGIGVGPSYGYGYDGYYAPRYSCDRYSRWYDPYRCGSRYGYGYGYGPAYYGSSLYFGFNNRGYNRGYRGGYRGGSHGGGRHHR